MDAKNPPKIITTTTTNQIEESTTKTTTTTTTTHSYSIINGPFISHVEEVVKTEIVYHSFKSKAMKLTENEVRAVYGNDIACIAEHFNILLRSNALATKYLPLTETSIFLRSYEGVIFCALANLIQANAVDEKHVVNSPDKLDDSEDGENNKMENRNLGITTLRALGLRIDKQETDYITKDTPFRITSVLVQTLRLATLGRMHFTNHEELVHLYDGWSDAEEANAILATDREKMLLRWVNYQLEKAGTTDELKGFDKELADSKVYAILLWTVAPVNKRSSLTKVEDVMKETDYLKRAQLIVKNAHNLGIANVIKPEHIANAGKQSLFSLKGLHNNLINVAFVYTVFVNYSNIDAPKLAGTPDLAIKAPPSVSFKTMCKYGASEDTLIRWLNSFGPSQLVVSFKSDLCNGSILLQVWDAMIPGSVNWSKVNLNYISPSAKRKFTWISNCDEVMNAAIKYGIPRNTCSPGDIVAGQSKNVLSLVFLMMRLHAQLVRKEILGGPQVKELDDNGLVQWFNEIMVKNGSDFKLKTLNDPELKSTNALGFIGERVLAEKKLRSSGPKTGAATSSVEIPPPPVPPEPKTPPAKSHDAVDATKDNNDRGLTMPDAAGKALSDPHDSSGKNWLFTKVQPVTSDLVSYSVRTILMFNKAGLIVYASKLGPDTDTSVYRSVLMELNALSMKH